MAKNLNALFVHGVGQQGPGFADDARQYLREVLGAKDGGLFSVSCHWAPLADAAEHQFLTAAKKRGSAGVATQKLVTGTLADALYWQSSATLRTRVFLELDRCVGRFEGQPYTALCHSLGGLIFTDWLRNRPEHRDNVQLVTFGCNIGLFNLGGSFARVKQLTRPNCWVNCFYGKDMLGFPLASDPALKHVHDVEVSPPWGFLATGLCHVRYWSDRSFWKKSLPKLLAL